MNKTLMIAAALLTLGVGSAFADGDVTALPAQTSGAAVSQHATAPQAQAYPSSTQNHEVWVYPTFRTHGYTQGGAE
jgi:hypothetical protein